MRGQVVRITKKENLKLGELHNCHFNAAEYSIANNCKFVCGFLGHTPHCICRQNGEYIDPTLNEEGYSFIPFICNYVSVCDGLRKVKEEELRDWWIYIANMQYEDCLVHH